MYAHLSPRDLAMSVPGQYAALEAQIATHQATLAQERGEQVAFESAAAQWYDTVYLPIVKVIRDTEILKEFPDKTEGDLYLWVLDHQHYLQQEEGVPLQPPEQAARTFLVEDIKKRTRKVRSNKGKKRK